MSGKKIPKQAWELRHKMLDAYPHWCDDPERIREVHPECSFRQMAGAPLLSKKRQWSGLRDRLAMLRQHGIDVVADDHDLPVAADDVVDAAAAAWSAHRIALGSALSLPTTPEFDADGRAVAIWY